MTWKELCKKAKEIGYSLVKKIPYEREQECLVSNVGYAFYRDGTCEFDCDPHNNLCGCPFAENRTFGEMYHIMKGLE